MSISVKDTNALTAKSSIELTSDLTSDTVPRLTTRNIAGISYLVFFLTLQHEITLGIMSMQESGFCNVLKMQPEAIQLFICVSHYPRCPKPTRQAKNKKLEEKKKIRRM